MNPQEGAATACEGILLVEDDADIRESIADILADEGYDVHVAENGVAALEYLVLRRTSPPCLILLDLMMPVMSGAELLDELRTKPRLSEIPVVILTAWPRDAQQMDGASGWVKKPVDLDQLLETVHQYCRPQ